MDALPDVSPQLPLIVVGLACTPHALQRPRSVTRAAVQPTTLSPSAWPIEILRNCQRRLVSRSARQVARCHRLTVRRCLQLRAGRVRLVGPSLAATGQQPACQTTAHATTPLHLVGPSTLQPVSLLPSRPYLERRMVVAAATAAIPGDPRRGREISATP